MPVGGLVRALGIIAFFPVLSVVLIQLLYGEGLLPMAGWAILVGLSIIAAMLFTAGTMLRRRPSPRVKDLALLALSLWILAAASGAAAVAYDLYANGPDMKIEMCQYAAIAICGFFILAGAIALVRVSRLA